MNSFPKGDLADYVRQFKPLVLKIHRAAREYEPLDANDLAAIERAQVHPFSVWLDQEPYFIQAKKEIEKLPYYREKIGNTAWRDNWWVQLRTAVATGFSVYFGAHLEFPSHLMLDSKRKKKISAIAGKLLDELDKVHVLEETKDIRLRGLLSELQSRLESGRTSELALSGKYAKYPRELLIKHLAKTADALTYNPQDETSQVPANIIAYLVAIVDPHEDIDNLQTSVRKLVNLQLQREFEADRIEQRAEAAGIIARQSPMNAEACPFCGQFKPVLPEEE